ncbi:lysylphosphatidylglycerol synthase domain-containing protein [Pendulispora albinea]|uniref:Flippase-like domain-containing protein n=1 Tax=Pendulispora albinea TaxID=2741071 RepID=A0ABZ2M7W3_9BACT
MDIPMDAPRSRVRLDRIAQLVLAAAAVALFVTMVPRGALIDALHLVRATGPRLALVLLPFAVAVLFDSAAQAVLFSRLGRKAAIHVAAQARLASEAIALSTPGGGVLGEPVAALVLARRGNIPPGESVAVAAARRVLLMRVHAAWIVSGALAGWSLLAARSHDLLGSRWLPWLILASALLPLMAATGVDLAFASGSLAGKVLGGLTRIVPAKIKAYLRKGEAQALVVDGSAKSLLRSGVRALLVPALLFGGVWVAESCEAYLIIHLLGGSTPFVHVMAIEASASILRAIAFFAPAGIGVQDMGYLALLSGGDPRTAAVATGFVIVKRGREALTIAMGLVTLALSARRTRSTRAAGSLDAGER